MAVNWVIVGGFLCGVLAGGASRYGRLCTMSAIEDALAGRDFRGAKAWGIAIVVAIAATQLMAAVQLIDLAHTPYAGDRVHILGTILGGAIFGLGMTLVGTCSFGLLVRAGGGDLRAAVAALIVGVVAIAMTAGGLAHLRAPLLAVGVVDFQPFGGSAIDKIISRSVGAAVTWPLVALLLLTMLGFALSDKRLRARRRLVGSAAVMGLSVAVGWVITTLAVESMVADRVESLSFVAPVGRALGQFMMDAFRNAGFGIATAAGVVVASATISIGRDEFRWEAFDDPIEMRRHLGGGALMGIGGVLAQGCTIGQGLSAASTLAITAPIFIASLLIGAKLGLMHLIEGRAMWRISRSK